jgi:peptide/nickel transport system substrate-binding protein
LLLLFILSAGALMACRQGDAAPPQATPAGAAEASDESTPDAAGDAETVIPVTPSPEPTPTITPTPLPPKDLVVCMGGEPADLYLYGDEAIQATAVRHALYESLYTTLGYDYQPLALEKLPSLADDDARLETVDVVEGDPIVDASGALATLGPGMAVVNADGQTVIFDGQPIQMARLVVDFTFKPLVWSDGEPVTAEDSVFSFHVAGDRATPHIDDAVRYIASYEATGERSVRWMGLPGYLDPAYMTRVWTPLPEHQLGDFEPAELPELEEAARAPLSYGAFVVESWTPGESIRLVPNPHYYRVDEGLPHLTSLTFRFLSPSETSLPAGYEECHILTNDLLQGFGALVDAEAAASSGDLVLRLADADVVEQIIFGINSTADVTWFQDARVRQAITQCVDRQAIVDEVTFGRAPVMDTFVPNGHALHPDDLPQWPYDPAAANALLDEVGYLDTSGDGIRDDIASTAPFTVTLGTYADSDLRQQINELVREDLVDCGIEVHTYTQEAGAWFQPGPAGTVFGRQFDLAAFAWLSHIQPDCGQYMTANIPGSPELGYNGWEGVNVSGFSNEAYDAACGQALSLLPGQPGYVEAHQEAMRIFAQELPAIPLFTHVRVAAATPDVLNFRPESAQPSELWNAFELDMILTEP